MGGYSEQVLFIHIPKCAGWSVKTYLREHVPGFKIPVGQYGERLDDIDFPIGHIPLKDVERYTGRHPSDWPLVLAVIRNPYDQQLSQWTYWRDRYARGGRHMHDAYAAQCPDMETFLSDPRCDFHVWYEKHHGSGSWVKGKTGTTFKDVGLFKYWLTVDGEVPDYVTIVKAENLDEELREAIKPYADGALPTIGRANVSGAYKKNTMEFYTPKAAKMVEEKAQWAFDNYYDRWLFSDFAWAS